MVWGRQVVACFAMRSAFHLHRDRGHRLGLGGADAEQAIAVLGMQAFPVDARGEAKAAAPGAVPELA